MQPGAGVDAIVGQRDTQDPLPFATAMPFKNGEKPTLELKRFVSMEGGEYFFAPSITTIRRLARKQGDAGR